MFVHDQTPRPHPWMMVMQYAWYNMLTFWLQDTSLYTCLFKCSSCPQLYMYSCTNMTSLVLRGINFLHFDHTLFPAHVHIHVHVVEQGIRRKGILDTRKTHICTHADALNGLAFQGYSPPRVTRVSMTMRLAQPNRCVRYHLPRPILRNALH